MVASKLKQIARRSLLTTAIVLAVGGIKAISTSIKVADAVMPEPAAVAAPNPEEVADFLVCSEAADWQRPSQEQQEKQLADDERYGGLLQDKSFQQLANQFWQHDVLSFTTYGLSARMEPVNLSGLWSVADDVWAQCYDHNQGAAINAGTLAEAWLMHHRIVDLQWQDDRYVMVVEPSQQGMQVVQFARHESEAELPLTVVNPQGVIVSHYDADW